jgi:hypothetical protein
MASLLMASISLAVASGNKDDDSTYCLDVDLGPFHMEIDGTCTVRDYLDGDLQKAFYPFTVDDHLFNCDARIDEDGDGFITLPVINAAVPVSVKGQVSGTIGGLDFSADLYCASLTNNYQNFPGFGLAQPFLMRDLPFPRITEVSVFDGVITVPVGKKKTLEIPVVMATRAAGIMHLEAENEVGASITHSLLGMLASDDDDDLEVVDASVDLLLQGHIFSPVSVEEDDGPARIRGSICSKELAKLLDAKPGKGPKK